MSDGDAINGVGWPLKFASVEECAQKCSATAQCSGFHYYGPGDDYYQDCYIKKDVKWITADLADGRDRFGGVCNIGKI